jgi:hypothetical protein
MVESRPSTLKLWNSTVIHAAASACRGRTIVALGAGRATSVRAMIRWRFPSEDLAMNSLAYLPGSTAPIAATRNAPRPRPASILFGLLALALVGGGCTAGTKPSAVGSAGTTGGPGVGGGGGTGGRSTMTGLAGAPGPGGQSGTGSPPPPDGGCLHDMETFEPRIPTVYLLVDRSGSMFPCLGSTDQTTPCADQANSAWGKLKPSILQVVQQLQTEVRFGFAAFNGIPGGACPNLERVAPALNNYDAIAQRYNGLPFRSATDKWETPTRRALDAIGAELMADTSPGEKYILFVTDGEPDYCGDGNPACPPDPVAGQLQTLFQGGIRTIVFGLQSNLNTLPPNTLQAFANAGAGEPTVAPLAAGQTIFAIFDQCFPGGDSAAAGWKADFLAKYPECATNSNTCRGRTVGTYADAAGPTKPYTPDAANQNQLVQQLSQALSGVKSCVFDMDRFMVNTARLDQAAVYIDGVMVALDPASANGWNMTSPTRLELYGSACTAWRNPNARVIDFNFPCDIIVQ